MTTLLCSNVLVSSSAVDTLDVKLATTSTISTTTTSTTITTTTPFVPDQTFEFEKLTISISSHSPEKKIPDGYITFDIFENLLNQIVQTNQIFAPFIPIFASVKERSNNTFDIVKLVIHGVNILDIPLDVIKSITSNVDFSKKNFDLHCPRPMKSGLLKRVTKALSVPHFPFAHALTLSALQGNEESISIIRKNISPFMVDTTDVFGRNIGQIVFRILNYEESNAIILMAANNDDLNKPNDYQRLPIHIASMQGNSMLVELSIFLGTDPSVMDDKCSPLHYAACFGRVNVAKVLLRNGAQWNIVDVFHKKPLDLARMNSHLEIISLLEGYESAQKSIDFELE